MKRKIFKRIITSILCSAMILSLVGPYSPATKTAKAFPAGTAIDERTYLTENEIKDTVLLSILRILANYTKARSNNSSLPELTGNEDLLSETYAAYNKDSFTFGELKAYKGPINLNLYADKIKSIEGLGYARGASSFDLGLCTTITEIPDNEFGKCAMTQITLPASVKSIGYGAFQQSVNLSKLLINGKNYQGGAIADLSGITKIGNFAFDGCQNLTNVTLSTDSALSIGASAFSNCTSLTNIVLPMSNANNLGESAFAGCTSLNEVTLNDNLTYIPSNLFSKATISTFKILGEDYTGTNYMPSGLTYVGKNAFHESRITSIDFSKCTKLTYFDNYSFSLINARQNEDEKVPAAKIVLPESLESIRGNAFNAANIFHLYIPDSVNSIESIAFANSSLNTISLSPNVTEITEKCFSECDNLYNIELRGDKNSPNKLTTIAEYAFSECCNLNDTDFLFDAPSLTSIGEYAFSHCYAINMMLKDSNITDPKPIDYIEMTDIYGDYDIWGLTHVNIPNTVTSLGKGCFSENYSIETVNLGAGITTIPEDAFYNLDNDKKTSKLKKVILSDKITHIGTNAFRNNEHLRTIGYTNGTDTTVTDGVAIFGNSLKRIEDYAFSGCSAENKYTGSHTFDSIVYKNVYKTDIHTTRQTNDDAFLIYDKVTSSLKEVYINPDTLASSESIEDTDITNPEDVTDVYVVAKQVWISPEEYRKSIVNTKAGHTGPLYFDFENNYGYKYFLTGILNAIDFSNAEFKSLPTADNDLGLYIQYSKIATGTTVRLYPRMITGLKEIILPDSLTDTDTTSALGLSIFANDISLSEVTMSKNVKRIPQNSFQGAATRVYDWTASNTPEIKYTYLGLNYVYNMNNVTEIENMAFYNCYALKLEESTDGGEISNALVKIGNSAFENCKSINSIVFHSPLEVIGNSAFKGCAEAEDATYEYTDNSNKKQQHKYSHIFKPNEANGLGLTKIDFTYATNIHTIGSSAFAANALLSVNLPVAKYDTVAANLFDSCEYLHTVTIPDNVKTIENNAFKDCASLTTLQMPATANVSGKILMGHTNNSIAGLQMIVAPKDYEQSLPIGRTLTLPINCISEENINNIYTISVLEDINDTTGTVIYNNGAPVTGDKFDNYLDAYVEPGDTYTNPDKVILIGKNNLKNDLIVKVEVGTKFIPFSNYPYAIINAHTFTYNVDIKPVPAEDISIRAISNKINITNATDATGKEFNSLYLSESHSDVTIAADILPATSTDECIWTIDNPEIASITPLTSGPVSTSEINITPLATGNTKLTVKCGNVKEEIYVYIKVPATRLTSITNSTASISSVISASDKFTLAVGDTDKITVNPSYNTVMYTKDEWETYGDTIIYSSDKPDIVSVDSAGNLTAKSVGTAVVTVKALASNIIITYTITVVKAGDMEEIYATTISEIKGIRDLVKNESTSLSALLVPAKAINKVKWEIVSGDATIAENGVVTAGTTPGIVTVKATLLNEKGNATTQTKVASFNVLQPATAITLTDAVGSEATMYLNQTLYLYKTTLLSSMGYYLTPANSTDSITATSADTTIVETSVSNGTVMIKAKNKGTTTITLTTSFGISTSFDINVVEGITSIVLPQTLDLDLNKSFKLIPNILPEDSNEKITWSSSSPTTVSVDDNGNITALKKGSATITARTSRGFSASTYVSVKIPATYLQFSQKFINTPIISVNKAIKLSAVTDDQITGYKVTPADSTDTITCEVADSSIIEASVTNNTVTLTGLKNGSTLVILRSSSGKMTTVEVTCITDVTKIDLPATINIATGESYKIVPAITPETSKDILTYSTSNEKIATVSADGTVTGIDKGTVTITAKASSGVIASVMVTVGVHATSLKLTKALTANTVTINAGQTFTLTKTNSDTAKGYSLVPDTATDTITATSSDPSVATVKTNGSNIIVSGIKKGSAIITLNANDTANASFNLTVVAPITKITLPTSIKLDAGGSQQLIPSVIPADHNDTITWKSSNEKVAIVSATGVVTAIAKGSATITATCTANKLSALTTVNVDAPCKKITVRSGINSSKLYMHVKQTRSICLETLPLETTDTYTYTSSKPSVVSVNGNGTSATLTANKKGSATITVKAGSGVVGTLKVSVAKKAKAAKKIKLSGSASIPAGSKAYLKAKVTAKKATDTITWTSSDSSVAQVDSCGGVKGIKKGIAYITASTSSGITDTYTVYIDQPAGKQQKLTVSGKKAVKRGKTITLKAKTKIKVAKKDITWSTSSSSIATVNSKGKVKGVGKGTVKITAKLKTGHTVVKTIKVK